MAVVYLAEDLKHRRMVAIKTLLPELSAAVGGERFLREIEIAARLSHPNILPLIDSGDADGVLYYVMPFVDGESLRARLERDRQLPVNDAVEIVRDVARALAVAHARGVVHRDVKPENILLTGGAAVVADFGIASALSTAGSARLTATGLSLGTPLYMSPEQVSGDVVDGRSDVYSLGCVLYEMLAGEPPHHAATAQKMMARRLTVPATAVSTLRPEVPVGTDRAVARALAPAPADRFATATEFAEALTTGAVPGRRTPTRRHALLLAGAVLSVALIGAAIVIAGRSSAALDAQLLVVAPFDVLDPQLSLWHEGIVDLLSRGLDGAGPLRTVSPTVVIHRWQGRSDPVAQHASSRRPLPGFDEPS